MNISKTIATIVALSAVVSLPAATFDVTTQMDSGPGSLRQAILDANAATGNDTIIFSVTGTILLATNLPMVTDDLNVVGPGTNLLAINGNGQYHAFYFASTTTNSLSDLTIADCRTRGYVFLSGIDWRTNASGISSWGHLTLKSCVVERCMGTWNYGGAVFNGGYLDMQNCTLQDSGAFLSGDGESRGGGLFNSGTAHVRDSLILRCKAGRNGAAGGGIYNTNGASLFVSNTRIESCLPQHTYADGIGLANLGNATLNSCVISNCYGYWGGGIESQSAIAMTNTTVINNRASVYGGGLMLWGQATLSGCTISGNRAWNSGGGITTLANLKMYNCTVSQNTTVADYPSAAGAGIADNYQYPLTGTTYLNHCTVVSNTVATSANPAFGEVSVYGSFRAENSILGDCKGPLDSRGHNLLINANGATVTNDVTGNLYNVNPMLGPLQNNGGATWTHALLSGSTAIDNGTGGGLTTDQRGALRSTPSDIGAYEVVSITPPNLQITRTAPTQVTVSWPSVAAPLLLQETTNLTGGGWTEVTATPADNGASVQVVLPMTGENRFYRLRNP